MGFHMATGLVVTNSGDKKEIFPVFENTLLVLVEEKYLHKLWINRASLELVLVTCKEFVICLSLVLGQGEQKVHEIGVGGRYFSFSLKKWW